MLQRRPRTHRIVSRPDQEHLQLDFELTCRGYLSTPSNRLLGLLAMLADTVTDRRTSARERAILQTIRWGIKNKQEWDEMQRPFRFRYRPVFALDDDHEPIWAKMIRKDE